jgi:hypothetical protein
VENDTQITNQPARPGVWQLVGEDDTKIHHWGSKVDLRVEWNFGSDQPVTGPAVKTSDRYHDIHLVRPSEKSCKLTILIIMDE